MSPKGFPSSMLGKQGPEGGAALAQGWQEQGEELQTLPAPPGTHLSTQHVSPQKDHSRNFFLSPSRKPHAVMSLLVLICGEEKEHV